MGSVSAALREEALGVIFELTYGNGHEHQVTIKRVEEGKFEMVAMEPPEPHRLQVIQGVSKTKDSEIDDKGNLNETPNNNNNKVVQSAVTTKQLDAIFKKMSEMQLKIESLQGQVGQAGTCTTLKDVKDTLAKMGESEPEPEPEPEAEAGTYQCSVCKHIYNADNDGNGISFDELPSTWTCPQCGAAKSAYKKMTRRLGEDQWVH